MAGLQTRDIRGGHTPFGSSLQSSYLTLCTVLSLFWFRSSSCFFFSVLPSRLASSETSLASMSLVLSSCSFIFSRGAAARLVPKTRLGVCLKTKRSSVEKTNQILRDGSFQGLLNFIYLKRFGDRHTQTVLEEREGGRRLGQGAASAGTRH